MEYLKQSTAANIKLGPFLDDTDGKTAETALAIAQVDIRLSKNGEAFAQTNNAAGATHDENGWYGLPLNTTDTGTLGRLRVAVHESGALPCFAEFMVVTANIYDSLCSTDKLEVDLFQMGGVAQSAADLKDFADAGYDPATNKIEACKVNDDMVGTDSAALAATALSNATWTDAKAGYLDHAVSTVDTVVDGIQTDLSNATDGLGALKTLIDTVNTDLSNGTDGLGALKTLIDALNDVSTSDLATALTNIHLDHLLAADYDPASKPGVATALLNEMVENDGGVSRYTANALEQAPSGGTNPNVLIDTTIASVTSQTVLVLTAGSNDDDAYKDQAFVVYDASDNDFPSIRVCNGYAGATRTVTLDSAPDFTIIPGDGAKAFVTAPGTTAPTVGQIRAEMDSNSTRLSAIETDTAGISGDAMRGTDGANTTVPDAAGVAPTAVENRQEMDANSTKMAPSQTLADYKATGFSVPNEYDTVIAALQTDLDSPNQYKADVSALALEATLTAIKGTTFDTATDSLEAVRNRGDAAWVTGGGGTISDILNVQPLIPNAVDLANTATVKISLGLTNMLDDLPSTAEIVPGTITIDRKAIGGTSWANIVSAAACSEAAGLIYYDEVFDSGTGYVAGDTIRVTFKNQRINVAANDYEITGADGWVFHTYIREAMRGTDGAALASVCTETRLAELDAANVPTDIADIPTVAEFNARSLPSADYVVTTDTIAGVTTATNLTNAPTSGDLTATMKTSVKTEADTALSDIHLDHLLAANYDPANKPGTATALLNELVENDSGVSRYTANALEQAPSGTGASAATIADAVWDEAIADHISGTSFGAKNQKVVPSETLADYKATGFNTVVPDAAGVAPTVGEIRTEMEGAGTKLTLALEDTDELQINQGDWATATGFSTHSAANVRTEMDGNSTKMISIETDTQDIQSRIPAALATGRMSSDAVAISGSTDAADKLEASAETIVPATVNDAGASTTVFITDLSSAVDDFYNGRVLIFVDGALAFQATAIEDYNGTTKAVTVVALTAAPANAVGFVVV